MENVTAGFYPAIKSIIFLIYNCLVMSNNHLKVFTSLILCHICTVKTYSSLYCALTSWLEGVHLSLAPKLSQFLNYDTQGSGYIPRITFCGCCCCNSCSCFFIIIWSRIFYAVASFFLALLFLFLLCRIEYLSSLLFSFKVTFLPSISTI